MSKKPELTPEQKKNLPKIGFYLTDEEIRTRVDSWNDWLEENCQGDMWVSFGSSSYATSKRQIVLLFEFERDAVLFRTWHGGKVVTDGQSAIGA